MQVFGPAELLEDVLQAGRCVGCGACVNICPYLRTYKAKTAMLFACSSNTGRCHAYCPKTEVDLDALAQVHQRGLYCDDPLGACREIAMSRGGIRAGEGHFQDGGTVSALMMFALDASAIDAAVLTGREGLMPAPGLAASADEVKAFSGSKYTAAPTLAALNRAIGDGFRKLGLVGTPCQLTAAAKMRANPLQLQDFFDPIALCVGIFCTWALDARRLNALIRQSAPGETVRKMAVPPPPADVLVVETDARRLEIPIAELRDLVPEGCGICPDMTGEWSDVSVGGVEGRPGWNTLIIRSEFGERLVKKAVAAGYLELSELPAESRAHLCEAASAKKRRALEEADKCGLLNTGEGGRAALRLRRETVQKLMQTGGGCHDANH
jgi:coenzyme F420 hydrogenase subunit beta